MSNPSAPRTTTQHQRWFVGLSAPTLLIFVLLCCWPGLFWQLPGVSQLAPDHIDRVQGRLDVLIPARWLSGIGRTSRDGRYIATGWNRFGQDELFIWDMASGNRVPITETVYKGIWLNDHQFIILDIYHGPERYVIMDARDGELQPVTLVQVEDLEKSEERTRLLESWRTADEVYLLEGFSYSSYSVLTLEGTQARLYLTFSPLTPRNVASLVASVPHIVVPRLGWSVVRDGDRVYSHDGRFYAVQAWRGKRRLEIYTSSDELIAYADKDRWSPRIIGWAHDNSGVYFHEETYAATLLPLPFTPLFKLSPLTPEQQRWQTITTVAWWVGGLAATGGAAWWWVRRRQRRAVVQAAAGSGAVRNL